VSRKKISVDKELFIQCIKVLESKFRYSKKSELYEAISRKYFELTKVKLQPGLIGLRIANWNIPIKTAGGRLSPVKNTENSPKQKINTEEVAKSLYKSTPEQYHNLVKRILNGSRTAAIKLHCLECAGFQPNEVRHCEILRCANYLYRPYKQK